MPLSEHHIDIISRYKSCYRDGLTSQEASERRADGLNTVVPPIDCPKWVCCLLPCISHIPSMKQFRLVQPEDAEVLRNKKWIRYDAASLVVGDIVRLVEGDVVPADVVVISLGMEHADDAEGGKTTGEMDMTVDSHFITGEAKPRRISNETNGYVGAATILYYGSRVLEGACIALVVSTGKRVLLARLIQEKRWPTKEDISEKVRAEETTRDEEGISLMSMM